MSVVRLVVNSAHFIKPATVSFSIITDILILPPSAHLAIDRLHNQAFPGTDMNSVCRA